MSEKILPFVTVIGNFLSTIYDEAKHVKIEASDYKD